MKHPVAISSNQKTVVVDLVISPAAAQIAQQPHLLEIASALLKTSELAGHNIWVSKDMGRPIGNCDVIETTETDVIYYAQRMKSDVYTRFVKNKRLELTNIMSIELTSADDATFEIQQIILGNPIPPSPSEGGSKESRTFWATHAMLWGDWPTKSASITRECPW